jgi:hypothetical protein
MQIGVPRPPTSVSLAPLTTQLACLCTPMATCRRILFAAGLAAIPTVWLSLSCLSVSAHVPALHGAIHRRLIARVTHVLLALAGMLGSAVCERAYRHLGET